MPEDLKTLDLTLPIAVCCKILTTYFVTDLYMLLRDLLKVAYICI